MRIGCAFHSLRAVPEAAMREVLAALPADAPVHIHISEQIGEVQDCLALRGARPVEWLQQNFEVDARWTLVHATHLTEAETKQLAASGATVAICPTTEANLGDGLFPLRAWLDAGGAWGIGSDSHISVSPVEELRWLEYGQRLVTRHRNIAVSDGSQQRRRNPAARRAGQRRPVHRPGGGRGLTWCWIPMPPIFAGVEAGDAIDRWIFSGNRNAVREVHVAGKRVVADGRHPDRDLISARYRQALQALLAD